MATQSTGYSKLSIALHWLAAIAIVALFFTHEGERGSAQQMFHISGGAIIGIFLLWRAFRRPIRGFADKPDQSPILNLISQIVLWGLLVSIVTVSITGYLVPWSGGRALDIFGLFQIPSPFTGSREFHDFMEEIHDFAGHAFIPLLALHILGSVKHHFIDKDGVMQRMVRSVAGGR